MDMTGKPVQSMGDLAPKAERLVHLFSIPASLLGVAKGIVKLGFVEITPDEELMATKRAAGAPLRMAYEMAMESMRVAVVLNPGATAPTVHRLTTADGTADRVWHQLHPKLRVLAVTAYGEIHNPKDGEANDFLQSREVSAG